MNLDLLSTLGWKPFFQTQLSLEDLQERAPMRISEVHRTQLLALDAEQEHILLFPHHERWSEQVTVGDWVLTRRVGNDLYVDRVLERDNGLYRRASGTDVAEQWIAANLDAVLIVMAADETFSLNRMERYLAVLLEQRIEPVIVITKADLYADAAERAASIHQPHTKLLLDARKAYECEGLQRYIVAGQTIALIGTSGVGKTTLTNALAGEQLLATQSVRAFDQRGRHTTTARHLIRLPSGGLIIDTPGMRGFRLPGAESGLNTLFADILTLAHQCRFRDCEHENEPGCAIQAALASGELQTRRYENYHKMLREQAFHDRELKARHEVRIERRKFTAKVKASSRFKEWRRNVGARGDDDS